MKFGYFDDINSEYVITTPKTPLPWINYLGSNGFFSLISNTCGGYSFYKDAKLRRITRFRYNNVPRDFGGKYIYIKDGETIWNPGYMPTKTELDSYECRHGLGYTTFYSSKNNVFASLITFVPINDNCEVTRLTIKNNSSEVKELKIYSVIEWCLWNAVDDSTNFQRNYNIGEVEIENNTIYHKTEYRERRDHYAFYHVNSDISGYETDLDTFVGPYNGWEKPDTVFNGKCKNSHASGWSPIACHELTINLKPGEEKSFIFTLGYIENEQDKKFIAPNVINKDKAYALINKYDNVQSFDEEFIKLKEYWVNLLSKFHISSTSKELDRMVNIWNQYQCMVTFNMSRSASYYESGTGRGMGFRDSCQDLLGFVHLIPERSRERILDIAAIQSKDGSTYHQYQPLTKRGNADVGSGFNDDPLWLIACTVAYIKETGDFSILNEQVQYNNEEGSEEPLMNHLRASINYTITHKGPHGLPLIGRADWNDCLNLNCFSEVPGESFQTFGPSEGPVAESVFIAGMFVKYGKEYAELCKRYGDKKEADYILEEVKKIEEATIKFGWDGEWFLRAYDAFEHKIGSRECEEGQIFIEPQGFCVMAGIGKELGFGKKALESVDKYLVNDYGVEILHPCYTRYHLELGEISSYPPGYKENGSVFCHNNPWIVCASAEEGLNEFAWKIYKKNCPAYLENVSEIHRTEPYVYSQTIAGRDAQNYGEAKNSFLTGTASWTFVAASQAILGIKPDYDGLLLKPCLPKEIKDVSITRYYRGKKYNISISNSNTNTKEMIVNGVKVDGDLVPFDDSKEYNVEIKF